MEYTTILYFLSWWQILMVEIVIFLILSSVWDEEDYKMYELLKQVNEIVKNWQVLPKAVKMEVKLQKKVKSKSDIKEKQ